MFDFLKLKKSLDGVRSAIKELQKTVESKRAEYERISPLPASREEVLGALCFYVDSEARTFPSHLAAQVKNMGTKPEDLQRLRSGARNMGIVLARRHAEVLPSISDVQASLLYLVADPIKKALSVVVKDMPWPADVAPPRAERDRQLEKLDRQISTLEQQEKELIEQAAGLGLRV